MIKTFKATNLNRGMNFDLQLNEDINIITGANGSGKTTVLKLLWYAISGNLDRILPEISFDSFEMTTDNALISITKEEHNKKPLVKLRYKTNKLEETREKTITPERLADWPELKLASRHLAQVSGESIFFPTFRRIEGGFSISTIRDQDIIRLSTTNKAAWPRRIYESQYSTEGSDLQRSLNSLAERLSNGMHRFVTSISTDDLVRLLTNKYAEVSEKTNKLHMDLSRFILDRIADEAKPTSGDDITPADTRQLLDIIQSKSKEVTEQSGALLRPFTVLNELISKVFQYKGIRLAGPVTLGEATQAIASEVMSAGEKQMLSFLSYNAFANRCCIFIDEPEISLHVDWQRTIFPVLLKQATGNQFIIATHSPFIYSKYADKEIVLSTSRGDENANAPND